MDKQESAMIVPIPSPWRDVLLQFINQVQEELFIICPYIKEEVITALKTSLLASQESRTTPLRVRVLTRVRAQELLTGSSDLSALQQLLRWPRELTGSSIELRAIDNIHAKVWIIDSTRAIVGSGNATPSGLDENLEYGLAVANPQIIAQIRQDWELWWEQAPVVNEQQLEQMQDWLTRSRQLLQEVENARREMIRTVGQPPRIGQHLSPRSRRPPASRPDTPPSAPGHVAEIRQAYTTLEAITVSNTYLLAALRWVYPYALDPLASPPVTPPASAFLKLIWDKNASQLHFTWANGQRRSQSSIPAHGGGIGSSWAITLDLGSVQGLVFHLANAVQKVSQPDVQLSLSHNDQRQWQLQMSCDSITYQTRTILTNPPPPFPLLQAPVSHITGVSQSDLLGLFEFAPWKTQLTTLWLHLEGSFPYASFFFTPNTLEHPIRSVVLGEQSLLVGPPIALQLASADFQQALLGTPDTVTRWSIEIDRNAEAMQLIPETNDEILKQWKHLLWHVGG